jgi:NAD dependent epimerase/dehydratase
MSTRKVLVTGAGGFIGSHLVEALVARGVAVRAFVFYNSLNSWGWLDHAPEALRASIEVFAGDVRDPHGVRQAMKGCDTVLHLAALIGIPYSYHSPDAYVDTNIRGTLNVLQAARDLDVERVVHTSTSEVYGSARFVPITEEHPLQGQSPYSATKIGADQLALSFHRSFGTPVTVARPFNTYGPRQSARAVIPSIIVQLASGARRLDLGALEPTRDFSYVEDTVRGFIALAEAPRAVGEVVNLGSGFEISIGELAGVVRELMRVETPLAQDAQRLRPEKSEVTRLLADNTRAAQLAGWRPEYAGREGLRRGLAKTIEWFAQPENLRCYKANLYNI